VSPIIAQGIRLGDRDQVARIEEIRVRNRQMVPSSFRILYISPLAHMEGHWCSAAIAEAEALSNRGQSVTLLTFAGLLEGKLSPDVRNVSVIPATPEMKRRLLRMSGKRLLSFFFIATAFLLTLLRANSIAKKSGFDVIYLRDGPTWFLALPQLTSMILRGQRWVVSLLDIEGEETIMAKVFKPTRSRTPYRISFSRNAFLYTCQNERLLRHYSTAFLHGVLNGRVYLLPPVVPSTPDDLNSITPAQARSSLGISPGSFVFLSFGTLHHAKDMRTVVNALKRFSNAQLLHAGRIASTELHDFVQLRREMPSNYLIHDWYIPEDSKPLYFAASSAIILSYARDLRGTASMLWEACRFQLPVIASNNEQLADMISRFGVGLTFEAQNPDSLTDAISRFLFMNETELAKLKSNCRLFCNEFSESKWADRFLTICNQFWKQG
jgi:glycosyltransferase involved in cell wall biosynthesis